MTTENPLQSIAERIDKKSLALQNDQNKIKNLDAQIALYEKSKDKLKITMAEKQAEIDSMVEFQIEVQKLVKERDRISEKMAELVEHYEQFEWSEDMPAEHKLSSSNYDELRDQKFEIMDRINEAVKQANKIYYRR